MIYPIIDPDIWTETYGVTTKDGECSKCNKPITANIPFADGDLRGFVSKEHGCGRNYSIMTFISVSKEDKKFWRELN
jgi:hypothetical protein